MAKRSGFYKHEKRQKELAKQKKKQEKLARKNRRSDGDSIDDEAEGEQKQEEGTPQDQWPSGEV
ncbi:MAG: hypothetical protein GY854_02985 [Deltaproteobacteria bacterium]|nr:hypothetical protein [Deltaproteobacteria bacterium]